MAVSPSGWHCWLTSSTGAMLTAALAQRLTRARACVSPPAWKILTCARRAGWTARPWQALGQRTCGSANIVNVLISGAAGIGKSLDCLRARQSGRPPAMGVSVLYKRLLAAAR